ncbi:hypothetical protein CCR75_000808 [Bremia lactucae]|uniref:WRKY19-like zinc finger domain-containing protein n=1 Tax=Bremia lactucae TaxID=4779 RepID=A0A976IHN4_BRELC|nr:hypothetical protein CCR75_000808 [Bremia lactucae]
MVNQPRVTDPTLYKNDRTLSSRHPPYTDLLLGDMTMMGCEATTWSCAQQRQQYASRPQSFGLSGPPPTMLTRHNSMPSRHVAPPQYPMPFAMGVPPSLTRHHSQSYVQPSFNYQASMNVPMPPRQVHVNEMQRLLEISMDQQQPVQFSNRIIKPETTSMNVEPIAFVPTDPNAKLAIDDIDPLVYDMFEHPTTLKSELPGMPQDIQQIESAFDSLDRLLPEMEREILFRSSEIDHFAASSMAMHGKGLMKSPKSMVICKVGGCQRRVRSKGFCKTHGGGRKCSIDGCKKSSQNGDFCIGHGGGKKCKEANCAKAAQSHGLCKAHGGGARCKFLNCNKSSQGGGLCRAHGGGKRCQAIGCPKGAQRGNFCATHGGFRNCKIEGCIRTDRGGGYCEVHRRGRLCKVDGCKKLSRNQGMCTMHIREDKQMYDQPESPVTSVEL